MLQWDRHYPKTLLSVLVLAGFLAGCQPSSSTNQADAAKQNSSENAEQAIPLITAQTVPVKLQQSVVCETDECTNYQLATVKTNVAWIDEYFLQRIKKDVPLAFKATQKAASEVNPSQVNQNQYRARYLGQNNHLASFVLDSSSYNAGAAHGMYHSDYVVLDLSRKQRVMADQLVQTGKQQQVIDALYEANQQWLSEHELSKDKLELSDNFYYGVHGIVFVYPLYEIASYADGMPELTLPYHMAQGLIKPEYLPK
ncbi:RsiV family protein [Acinetobacter sp. MD2(2019)]|uniref:RsiV family protein n=1 Tax=Acinetobacter sp. MD2(2019) TaxID=2605273 RepID=UPI002D1E66F9|nr:DUF3298 domain-containing protein [Acinetobacter sp. MD2(2019)]MEB3753907.1 DUF3298 domain-containing protein [Acinetobacter sp. MD2(2019)]